jgi:TonB family protein
LKADDVVAAASPASAVVPLPEPVVEESTIETLMPLKRVDPKVPSSVLGAVRSGHVEVHFTVLPDGSVADPAVDKTTNRRLIPYALEAVAQWKFAPLKRPQTGAVDLVFNFD